MHKSRLAGFIIDCNTGDIDAAATFWTQALGYELAAIDGDPGIYRTFDTGPSGLHIEVQKVEHPSRVHLDIETDDIEAEATRLEALGAKKVGAIPALVGAWKPRRGSGFVWFGRSGPISPITPTFGSKRLSIAGRLRG